MTILVLDIGTSGVRACVVGADATIVRERSQEFLPDTPFDGLVEFDAVAYVELTLELARAVLADHGNMSAGTQVLKAASQLGSSWTVLAHRQISPSSHSPSDMHCLVQSQPPKWFLQAWLPGQSASTEHSPG